MKVNYSGKSQNNSLRYSSDKTNGIGKWFIIWLIMPILGIALAFVSLDITNLFTAWKSVITVLSLAYIACYVFVFFKLGKYNDKYIEGGIIYALVAVLQLATRNIFDDDDKLTKGILAIILLIVQIRMYYCFARANSAVTYRNKKLCSKWKGLCKWWKVSGLGLLLSIMFIALPIFSFLSNIALIVFIVIALIAIILLICDFIFLCMTAVYFNRIEKE